MLHKIRHAFINKQGFTLVEILIAMVIILIAMLGMYKVTVLSIDGNVRNVIRNEGVKITEEVMNRLRAIPFDELTEGTWTDMTNLGYTASTVTRTFRNMTVSYAISITVNAPSSEFKVIEVVVGWDYKGENPPLPETNKEFQQKMVSIVRNPVLL